MVTGIIVAAGSSRRMGFDKLGADLCGKPVLRWAVEAFDRCGDVGAIVVVASADRRDAILEWGIGKVVAVVEGGTARHDSVSKGLDAVPEGTEWVAVHDGARPLISGEAISGCILRARETGAAALARPVTDTVKRVDGERAVSGSVERMGLWAMETPQVFSLEVLQSAYRRVLGRGDVVTDEVSAVQANGGRVYLIESVAPNLKITFARDLEVAEALVGARAHEKQGVRV